MFLNCAFTRSSSSVLNESGDFGASAEVAGLAAADDCCVAAGGLARS
jgi:uncharacterized membrane protein